MDPPDTPDVSSIKTEPICNDGGDLNDKLEELEDNIEIIIENADNCYPGTVAGKPKNY